MRASLNDLFFFNQYILDNGKVMNEKLHKEMCDFSSSYRDSAGSKNKKLLLEPRGTLKSTCVTIAYPLQLMLKYPDVRILIDSEKLTNSKQFLSSIKGHVETNQKYRDLSKYLYGRYPNPTTNKEEKWTSSEVVSAIRQNKAIKEPTISCGGVDVVKVGMHYDVIIVDDPVSDNNTGTREQIEKVIQHYKLLLSLLEPNGKLIIIGTRWDFGDLYGYIIDNQAKFFDILIRKARQSDGTLLFPERLSEKFLEEQKESQGSYIFSCQYQNEPIPREDATFKWSEYREWIGDYSDGKLHVMSQRKYTGESTSIEEFSGKVKMVNVFMTIDPAISQAITADYTAIVVCAVDLENHIYVLDYVNERLSGQKFWDEIFRMYQKYNPKRWGIEVNAFQKSLSINLQEEMKRRGLFISRPDELKSFGDKETRIRSLQPRYEVGALIVKKGMDNLKYQLVNFPRTTHDDLIDALSYILQIAYPKQRKEGIKREYKPLYSSTGY